MPCYHLNGPNGAIICCGRTRARACSHCGRPSSKLCDFPLTGVKAGKTCDRPICDRCAVHIDPDTDYCQPHARIIDAQAGQLKLEGI